MSADGEVVLLPVVVEDCRPLLLEAYTRGRYAAQAGFRVDNPYREDVQMATAWQQGWEDVCGCD